MKPFYLAEIECSQAGQAATQPYYRCAAAREIACLGLLIADSSWKAVALRIERAASLRFIAPLDS